MTNKEKALNLLKDYYKNFYNTYAATNPYKIKMVDYFLKWLDFSASVDDIEVEEVDFHVRYCEMMLDIDYYYYEGSGDHYQLQAYTHAYFSTIEELEVYYSDTFYTKYASSEIVPDNLNKVAKARAEDYLAKSFSVISNRKVLSKVSILNQKWSEPKPDRLLRCTINYPHPIEDKNGSNIRAFYFMIWNSTIEIPKGPDEKSRKMYKGPDRPPKKSDGCYIATCVYGSYECPQVWTLRRYRDDTLGSAWYGRLFIRTYYAISPTLVKWFGDTNWFKKLWRGRLDRMVANLKSKGVQDTPYQDKQW